MQAILISIRNFERYTDTALLVSAILYVSQVPETASAPPCVDSTMDMEISKGWRLIQLISASKCSFKQ